MTEPALNSPKNAAVPCQIQSSTTYISKVGQSLGMGMKASISRPLAKSAANALAIMYLVQTSSSMRMWFGDRVESINGCVSKYLRRSS